MIFLKSNSTLPIVSLVLFGLVFFTNCSDSSDNSKGDSQVSVQPEGNGGSDSASSEDRQRALERTLFNLLSDWKASQNKQDFISYQNFYGNGFKGIKRSGDKTYEFDREGWIQDRGKMFKKSMEVATNDIRINYKTIPYKIQFEQVWKSGSYKDVGQKVLMVAREGENLKIIKEEMLNSKLIHDADANNALENPNFFQRAGTRLVGTKDFKVGERLNQLEMCSPDDKEICYTVHQHLIKPDDLDQETKSMIGKKVFFGNIADTVILEGEIGAYRMVREELTQELPGIQRKAGVFEIQYTWIDGNDEEPAFTKFHPMIYCKVPVEGIESSAGQWAVVGDELPDLYYRSPLSKWEEENYAAKIKEMTQSGQPLAFWKFSNGIRLFVVASNIYEECGEEVYGKAMLYEISGGQPKQIKELPDNPSMILDIGKDGNLEILYESEFSRNPDVKMFSQGPFFYEGENGDTIFIGCGC